MLDTPLQRFILWSLIVLAVLAFAVCNRAAHIITAQQSPADNLVVSTLAGTGVKGFGDGPGANAEFSFDRGVSSGISVGSDDIVFVSDTLNHRVRAIATDGTVSTLAGNGQPGFVDGPGNTAEFGVAAHPDWGGPTGLTIAPNGTLYTTDTQNNRVRAISQSGYVSALAGSGGRGRQDGLGTSAQFNFLSSLAVGPDGDIYAADAFQGGELRKITPSGQVTTIAHAASSLCGDIYGAGVAVGPDGSIYTTNRGYENAVCRISPDGHLSLLAGGSQAGYADGPATTAMFSSPEGLAMGPDGSIYVADMGNGMIRRISPAGIVSTVAGIGNGYTDGPASSARFDNPIGVAVSSDGTIYVQELGQRVRKIAPASAYSSLAIPSPPTNLSAAPIDANDILLTWATTSGRIDGIEIYDELNGGLIITLPGNATSYILVGLSSNIEYCVSVTAYNSAGTSDYSTEACATTLTQ
jgi:sugar lactone lactonase YvrE